MTQPDGFVLKGQEDKVCKLLKSLSVALATSHGLLIHRWQLRHHRRQPHGDHACVMHRRHGPAGRHQQCQSLGHFGGL
jgi:hypothetical protein